MSWAIMHAVGESRQSHIQAGQKLERNLDHGGFPATIWPQDESERRCKRDCLRSVRQLVSKLQESAPCQPFCTSSPVLVLPRVFMGKMIFVRSARHAQDAARAKTPRTRRSAPGSGRTHLLLLRPVTPDALDSQPLDGRHQSGAGASKASTATARWALEAN